MSGKSSVITPKILAIGSNDWNLPERTEVFRAAKVQLERLLGTECELVDLKDWFKSTFSVHGSRDSWLFETVRGRDYATRRPLFNLFLCCTGSLDATQAQLVQFAFSESKPVLGFSYGNESFLSISSLEAQDGEWGVRGSILGE